MSKYLFVLVACALLSVVIWAATIPVVSPPVGISSSNSLTVQTLPPEKARVRAGEVPVPEMLSNRAPAGVEPEHQLDALLTDKATAQAAYERWLLTGMATPAEKDLMQQHIFGAQSRIESPLDDIGGPDSYGYRYVDNLNGDSATYSWIELRGDPAATWLPSTNWTSHDDGYYMTAIPLSFGFPFYGVNRTQFWVSSNGQITFNSGYAYDYYTCVPAVGAGSAVLPFMHDLHLDRGGISTGANVVGYRDFGSYMVIEYDSIGFYSCTGGSLKFQAILFADGRIKFQYNNVVAPTCANAGTVGIQSAGATPPYLQYRCQNTTEHPITAGRAIWFYAPPCGVLDFACAGITSPQIVQAPGVVVNVVAIFANVGCATTASPVKYRFNNGPVITEATAALPLYGTETHTFATPITLPTAPGAYELVVWSDLAGDVNRANDTLRRTVNILGPDYVLNVGTVGVGVDANTCGAGDNCNLRTGQDIIVQVNLQYEGQYIFTLCNSVPAWDTYLFLSASPCGTPIASNDEYCGSLSEISCTFYSAGTYYLTIEPYYSTGCGAVRFDVIPCPPCNVVCPPEAIPEGEPNCYDGYIDGTNSGCSNNPPLFSPIGNGQTVCGTAGNYVFQGLNYRDTDWYRVDVVGDANFWWRAVADFPVRLFVLRAPCPGTILATTTAAACEEAVINLGVEAGTYYLWIGPQDFSGIPCGSQYWATCSYLTFEPVLGRCCYGDPISPACADNWEFMCDDLGGQWTEGLFCATTPCPSCFETTVTAPGTFTGNTSGAGDDCALRPSEEVTIAVEIPTAGEWTFSLCDGTTWDTYLYVTGSCCDAGSILGQNDEACGSVSRISCLNITQPGTVYVTVEGWNQSDGGPFTLSVQPCQGRCCYGDPLSPLCQMTSPGDCAALNGAWTEGMDCSVPCWTRPGCGEDGLVAQYPSMPDEEWYALGSDYGYPGGVCVYEDFVGLTEPVGRLRFWGLNVVNNGSGWQPCSENAMPFEVKFWEDNAGLPGAEVAVYSSVLVGTPVDLSYLTYPLYQYELPLDPPILLPAGWVSIQGAGDPDCWFLWLSSPYGNDHSLQRTGTTYDVVNSDVALCFGRGACEPVTVLTARVAENVMGQVVLDFLAPEAGEYRIYSTTTPNNSGDPVGDPPGTWTQESELQIETAGAASWTDVDATGLYRNYVVIRDCTPPPVLGRCCYGEPLNPLCQILEYAECLALSGTWTFNLTCAEPCSTPQYCTAESACDEHISRLALNTIDHTSQCGTGGYSDFTAFATTLARGTSYTLTVWNGRPYTLNACGAWVDWNQDRDFEDPGETLTVTGNPGPGPYTTTVTPPPGAPTGPTRLRARIVYNVTPVPCGTLDWGETEDYTVVVE